MMSLYPLLALIISLPFEPLRPVLEVLSLKVSLLELLAAIAFTLSFVSTCMSRDDTSPQWNERGESNRPSTWRALTRQRLPLGGWVLAFLAVCLASSYLAEPPRALPFKFSLRITAGVVAFALTSWALARKPRFELVLGAFAFCGSLTAAIAVFEAVAPDSTNAVVQPFREHDFEVGGTRRLAATFAYPNLAAGFLVLTLPAVQYFGAHPKASTAQQIAAGLATFLMFVALLLTYSRGAYLGALAGLGVFWLSLHHRRLRQSRWVGCSLVALLLLTTAMAVLNPTLRRRASSEGDASWYRATLEPRDRELFLMPAQLVQTPVRVTNTGNMPWASKGARPFHLSYRWFTTDGNGKLSPLRLEGERTRLTIPLAPGEQELLLATVRAPNRNGRFVLFWDMVQEHTTWFSDKKGPGSPVVVQVGTEPAFGTRSEADYRSQLTSFAQLEPWHPGRRELWGLAWQIFRENPVLGIGPDNFRWQYGQVAGREEWDERTFANSLYLELLATLGIVGSMIFGGMFAYCLFGLSPRGGGWTLAGTAILSALSGFLVHGAFDYVLELSAMYLAVFILLGAASAVIRRSRRTE